MEEVSGPRSPGTDGLPRSPCISRPQQGECLPVKLSYGTAHYSSGTPHFRGNRVFITNVLLLLLLGFPGDAFLTSPGILVFLLQLISSFTSSCSWQVGGWHKDFGIQHFITRQCKILTGIVTSKCPLCEGK